MSESSGTGVAIAIALVALCGGCSNNHGRLDEGSSAQSDAEFAACAEVIVEGTVQRVEQSATPSRLNVMLTGVDWLKSRGDSRTLLDVLDPSTQGKKAFTEGTRALVVIPTNRRLSPDVITGSSIRSWRPIIERGLREAKREETQCPGYWQSTDGTRTQ